jgi:hypothetical protein
VLTFVPLTWETLFSPPHIAMPQPLPPPRPASPKKGHPAPGPVRRERRHGGSPPLRRGTTEANAPMSHAKTTTEEMPRPARRVRRIFMISVTVPTYL